MNYSNSFYLLVPFIVIVLFNFLSKGVNAALYWDKVDFKEYIALVPTSAHSGDGMGDLISLIVSHSEQYLTETLMFSKEVEAIVLEVMNEVLPIIKTSTIIGESNWWIRYYC